MSRFREELARGESVERAVVIFFRRFIGARIKLVVAEFWQLSRAEHRFAAHQQRRIHFRVAVLIGVQIEHELTDRALQPRQAFLQHHKARATQFGRCLEVHEPERAAEIVMRFRRERVFGFAAEHVPLHVAVLIEAIGHFIQRRIRDGGQRRGEFVIRGFRS